MVEGSGGPTWYTEYNVLTGLSARSYGRLSYYVTRIAAGRVERGLPQALRRCGYKTFTLYPAYGAFLSARKFQTTAGVERFLDADEMKAGDLEPDRFYYDQALRMIESEKGDQPLFIFVYTVFNHFPWWNTHPSRADAGLARSRQRARGRRVHPPPDAQRARLRRLQAAAGAGLSRTSPS